jgi:hypothetical protein
MKSALKSPHSALPHPKRLSRRRIAAALALAFLLPLFSPNAVPAAPGETSEATPQTRDYSSFRIIPERNIFNPSRSARQPARQTRNEPRRAPRVDSFTFVGTINYEKGAFAFFDSSTAEFRKALQPGNSIAGLQIKEVNDYAITLSNGTNTFDLRIGTQMVREEGGEWKASGSSGPAPIEAASEAPSGPQSDVLKRLMQKREQELR